MTFFRRGRICVLQCSPSSTIIQRRPILWATAAVVPDPPNESSTISLGWEERSSTRFISRSGLGVWNTSASALTTAITSFFASCVLPTSSCVQILGGTIPYMTSFKNRFKPGTLFLSLPHQTRLSLSNSSNFNFDTRQYIPLGGPAITRPAG